MPRPPRRPRQPRPRRKSRPGYGLARRRERVLQDFASKIKWEAIWASIVTVAWSAINKWLFAGEFWGTVWRTLPLVIAFSLIVVIVFLVDFDKISGPIIGLLLAVLILIGAGYLGNALHGTTVVSLENLMAYCQANASGNPLLSYPLTAIAYVLNSFHTVYGGKTLVASVAAGVCLPFYVAHKFTTTKSQ